MHFPTIFQRICNELTNPQIEQFIESIFPSQKPGQVKSSAGKLMSPEELAKHKQAEKENMRDMVYLMIAVILTLALVSGIMVYLPVFYP